MGATSNTSLTALQLQLEAALALPTPRVGDAFKQIFDAQFGRMGRRGWALLLVMLLVPLWFGRSLNGWLDWVMIAVGPLFLVYIAASYIDARGLARYGLVASARIEPLGQSNYALHFENARRAVWQVGRMHALDPNTPVTVLFHPRRRTAFAFAFAAGLVGDVHQDSRAKPPRARLSHGRM